MPQFSSFTQAVGSKPLRNRVVYSVIWCLQCLRNFADRYSRRPAWAAPVTGMAQWDSDRGGSIYNIPCLYVYDPDFWTNPRGISGFTTKLTFSLPHAIIESEALTGGKLL